MNYILLLRGINVGGHNKVEMKKLKTLLERLGCTSVSTYLNSGNAIFESTKSKADLQDELYSSLEIEFGFVVPILIKTKKEVQKIADAVPESWKNDSEQKTDVAYLFPEVDTKNIVNELPVKREFIDVRYVPGALIWNVSRENYNKSHLNKLISHKLYKQMTVRNVNTARYLAAKNIKSE